MTHRWWNFSSLSVLQRPMLSLHTATSRFCVSITLPLTAFLGPDVYPWPLGMWMEHQSPPLALENQFRAHALLVVGK